jgi:hypothetical protein
VTVSRTCMTVPPAERQKEKTRVFLGVITEAIPKLISEWLTENHLINR